jgi:hypothetical protein
MSQVLQASLIQEILATSAITSLLGEDSSGIPAVFPYHYRDKDERVPYPHVTVARFGDITERGIFQEHEIFATTMDCPRIAVCVWSTNSTDEAYDIYNMVDYSILRGPNANLSSQYFSIYKVRRTHLRDDLFDETAKAYHIHSEYSIWIQNFAHIAS